MNPAREELLPTLALEKPAEEALGQTICRLQD